MRILSAEQMREADRQAIDGIGIPSVVLMENAGREVVAAMDAAFDDLSRSGVVVLAGCGNNGGDGFVVARLLAERGSDVLVVLLGTRADVRGDARINLDVIDRLGVPLVEVTSEREWATHAESALARDIIVDAMFGTGLRSPLAGLHEAVAGMVNDAGRPVVAIDLPSGLSADRCAPIGPHVVASLTVTLGAPKLPLVLPPAEAYTGTVVVADIGIPRQVLEAIGPPDVRLVARAEARALVPDRDPDAHKGTYGHVLILAGSRGKTGAAHLAGVGALRSGAGLVTVATARSCAPVVAALGSEYLTLPLDETEDGVVTAGAAAGLAAGAWSVIAAGPGLGTGDEARQCVNHLLAHAAAPLVLDADAITVLAGQPGSPLGSAARPVILTPHPGELARLTGQSVADIQHDRVEAARRTAVARHAFVILKGHRTVVAGPDGRAAVNMTGNPGMATGGSGDVLTGAVAAWMAQLKDPWAACRLAVYLHGLAGDLAAAQEGDVGLTAGDIARALGAAYLDLTSDADTESP